MVCPVEMNWKINLLNIATGFLTPEEGAIILNGDNITHLEAWKGARLGVKENFSKGQIQRNLSSERAIVY